MDANDTSNADSRNESNTPEQHVDTDANSSNIHTDIGNTSSEYEGGDGNIADSSFMSESVEENRAFPLVVTDNISKVLDLSVTDTNLASTNPTNSYIRENSKLNKSNTSLSNSVSEIDMNKNAINRHTLGDKGDVHSCHKSHMLSSPPPQSRHNEFHVRPNVISSSSNGVGFIESSGKHSDGTNPKSLLSETPLCSDTITNAQKVDPLFHLLALPNDSMHSIASFLSPSDLIALSSTNSKSRRICRTIFRTIRMHGFRCAVEVVSAWIRGAHADARELAALYVKSGVPLYPPCNGHAYHTLTWRMSIEGRAMEARNSPEYENESPETAQGEKVDLDRFYADRYEARELGGYYSPSLTYLEEKCLFWSHYGSLSEHRSSRNIFLQPNTFQGWNQKCFGSHARQSSRAEDVVKIHRHLANQHFIGNPSVEDEANSVQAGPISLSHDFFHPGESKNYSKDPHAEQQYLDIKDENGATLQSIPDPLLPSQEVLDHDLNQISRRDVFLQNPMYYPLPLQPPILYNLPPLPESSASQSIVSDVTLEIYSGIPMLDLSARAKIESFQMKLETLSRESLSSHFSECLADFWDAFFPLTAGILFYDKYTAVPRMSSLSNFLSKPCPKAIGIVQCEIERIRCYPKNRKSVKGRFFPTYEYRLFIRDRSRNDSNGDTVSDTVSKRKDTVIMTAKNRGRNFQSFTGSGANSKRGVNNYFLYKATEKDSIVHHLSLDGSALPDDADEMNDLENPELGRLQSNFIGTEFQIFSPSFAKPSSKFSESDCETVMEDASYHGRAKVVSVKNEMTALTSDDRCSDDDNDNKEASRQNISKRRSLRKMLSGRSRSRRAIAVVDDEPTVLPAPVRCENEEGAITYTANLLGNRPRIMDVCIPRLSDDGMMTEWRRYVQSCEDIGDSNLILNRFKQLLERNNSENHEEEEEGDTPPDYGLLTLQNRPPWWNVELGAFVLNFGGRVSVASVKNFQLCDRNDQEHIMLQFGRIGGRHSFTMDFQYPLTAMQAFAIAISSLQSKISLG